METIISAFQASGILVGVIVIIGNIMEILLANDLDYTFFSKLKQKIGSILNSIILFLANTGLILLFVKILQNKIQINKGIKNFFDIIITFIIFSIIGAEIFCKIKFQKGILRKIITFIRDNMNIWISITLLGIDIGGVALILYEISQEDLIDNSFSVILLAAITYSFILIFLISLLRDVKFSDGRIAKFYLLENGEKYYIYYAKGKFLMCGTNINSDKSDKYKLIKIDEIDSYEIFRESEQIEEKVQIEVNEYRILDKLKHFFVCIQNKNKNK